MENHNEIDKESKKVIIKEESEKNTFDVTEDIYKEDEKWIKVKRHIGTKRKYLPKSANIFSYSTLIVLIAFLLFIIYTYCFNQPILSLV